LANIYFFVIEFGLYQQKGERKLFGAAHLGSVNEMHNVLSDKP
jgi:phenylalanine-4-hydroxylase